MSVNQATHATHVSNIPQATQATRGDSSLARSTSPTLAAVWAPRLLSVLRITTAFTFLQHGTAKLLGFPEVAMFAQLQLFSLMGLAGVLELVGGLLLLVGLFSRSTAFVLSGMMAVAYFMAHGDPWLSPMLSGGEAAYLFCFVFLYLAAAGPGPWSVDAARASRR